MAYIDSAAKQAVIDAVADADVAASLAVLDITEREVATLTSNLQLLTGAGDTRLWPDADTWLTLERAVLLELASAAAARHTAAESEAGRTLIRDSETMILELVHTSGDPAVLNTSPDQWLWSPIGPPLHGDYSGLSATERYPAHAAALGQSWNTKTVRTVVRHEVAVQKARIARAAQIMDQAADAISAGYGALVNSDDTIAQGVAVVAAKPAGPWPTQMSEWSDVGWDTAASLRRSAGRLLDSAAAATILEVLDDRDTNEERGILVAVARARLEALRRWWDSTGPVRPPAPADGSVDVSFWLAAVDPSAFWAAAMTAAWLELGRARDGGPDGVAAALLGR